MIKDLYHINAPTKPNQRRIKSKVEIQERIAKGIKCIEGLLHIQQLKTISQNVKKKNWIFKGQKHES